MDLKILHQSLQFACRKFGKDISVSQARNMVFAELRGDQLKQEEKPEEPKKEPQIIQPSFEKETRKENLGVLNVISEVIPPEND